MNGIINLYKPTGITSHTAVSIVRRLTGEAKAGHCGTLDPLACGVLPVMVGNAVKASEYLVDHNKKYRAEILLGTTTDTEDVTGKILTEFDGELPSFNEFEAVCQNFVGKIKQKPPMYSAIKINGKKLMDLARADIEIDRPEREIEIFSITAWQENSNFYLDVECSRGTYIRTLCADIGAALGCGACMKNLTRLQVGEHFSVLNSVTLDDLKQMDKNSIEKLLIDTKICLNHAEHTLPAFFERLFFNGCEIYLSKLDAPLNDLEIGDTIIINAAADTKFAVAAVSDYSGFPAIKMIKCFN